MEENNKGFLNMPVQSVKLNGSVQTIFQLWGLLLILAVCGLLGEIISENTIKFVFTLYIRVTQLVLKEVRKLRRKKIAFLGPLEWNGPLILVTSKPLNGKVSICNYDAVK